MTTLKFLKDFPELNALVYINEVFIAIRSIDEVILDERDFDKNYATVLDEVN